MHNVGKAKSKVTHTIIPRIFMSVFQNPVPCAALSTRIPLIIYPVLPAFVFFFFFMVIDKSEAVLNSFIILPVVGVIGGYIACVFSTGIIYFFCKLNKQDNRFGYILRLVSLSYMGCFIYLLIGFVFSFYNPDIVISCGLLGLSQTVIPITASVRELLGKKAKAILPAVLLSSAIPILIAGLLLFAERRPL